MTKLGGERGSVQNPLIKYAKEIGWEYVSPEEAIRLRGGETGLVFREMFISQLMKMNHDFLTRKMAEELIRRLERIPQISMGI